MTRQLGLRGALILEVGEGGGAARAGLRPTRRDPRGRLLLGDLITGLDGQAVASAADLVLLLEEREVGETVRLQVQRGRATREVDVVLQAAQ
jgi:S1-C subfamily serine protease